MEVVRGEGVSEKRREGVEVARGGEETATAEEATAQPRHCRQRRHVICSLSLPLRHHPCQHSRLFVQRLQLSCGTWNACDGLVSGVVESGGGGECGVLETVPHSLHLRRTRHPVQQLI